MSYKFVKSEPIGAAVRRVAAEQIDDGFADLDRVAEIGADESIHQVRKRCKKLRGLVRLTRGGGLDELAYRRENIRFRDLARRLSGLRDASALIETYDSLMAHYRDEVERRAFSPIRGALTRRRDALVAHRADFGAMLYDARLSLREGGEAVDRWVVSGSGYEAIGPGFVRTYARGRKAMAAARKRPDEERLHEWRKRVKYHWYHLRLIEKAWPKPLRERRNLAKAVADMLGDEHDLAVFREALTAKDARFGNPERVTHLIALVDRRRIALRKDAFRLGAQLYADKPARLDKQLRRAWKAWSAEGAKAKARRKAAGKSKSKAA